jgi:asparagine synthase (glutamine-hydrolysing)
MCGIAGIAFFSSTRALPDLDRRLHAMIQAMNHRGREDGRVYLSPEGRAGLGNRGLALRDLSPAGHIPMGNGASSLWVTCNGKIHLRAGSVCPLWRNFLDRRVHWSRPWLLASLTGWLHSG